MVSTCYRLTCHLLVLIVFFTGLITYVPDLAAQDIDPATVPGLYNPDGIAFPNYVTLVGTLQSEMGCEKEWEPRCWDATLDYVARYDLWEKTVELPAGDYEYKVTLDGAMALNYGLGAEMNGRNIPLHLEQASLVTFYFDYKTGWITDDVNSVIAGLKGITPKACFDPNDVGEFSRPCMQTWLQDSDGDGILVFQTPHLPAGEHHVTVVVDHGSGSELSYYGENGEPGGVYIPFEVPLDRTLVTFSWDTTTKLLTIETGGYVPLTDAEIVIPYCRRTELHPCQ